MNICFYCFIVGLLTTEYYIKIHSLDFQHVYKIEKNDFTL